MIFLATSTPDGGLDLGSTYNKARFKQYLKDNPHKNFRIEEVKRVRSLSQNSAYWMYLELIEKETGNGANDLHEYFKRALLAPKWLTVLGKEIKVPKSTTELTKVEFGDYMDKIAALSGVPIPDFKKYKEWLEGAPMAWEEFNG